jgi:hypothetical protein
MVLFFVIYWLIRSIRLVAVRSQLSGGQGAQLGRGKRAS